MRTLNALLLLLALFVIAASCQKENPELSEPADSREFTTLSLDEINPSDVDVPTAIEYTQQLFVWKAEGSVSRKQLLSLGNPQDDMALLTALLITETFSPEEVLLEESQEVENRGLNSYKWTGGKRRWSFWCFCYKYPANKYTTGTYNAGCTGYPINLNPIYRSCSGLDCAPFPSQCN
ncbi:MAG: hypothetical protein KDD06_03400 [Phaeodactylibacter sp.]|nr:hypothetical protein [Phaeodactylibacter sp.]